MRYQELSFHILPHNEAAADVLAALLADVGCESFVPTDEGLKAYVQQDAYDELAVHEVVATATALFAGEGADQTRITFTVQAAPDENWNATWEAEHPTMPVLLPNGRQVNIVPRQAFGSGEHATTRLMLHLLASLDITAATVIDAGCGTGILGIAAMKLGAARLFAYDIDEWSVSNTKDNFALNALSATLVTGDAGEGGATATTDATPSASASITLAHGDASCLAAAPLADVLMANIHRNILLADMPTFAAQLKPGGYLLLSGFYEADIPPLTQRASSLGLILDDKRHDEEWCALRFRRSRS